MSSEAIICALLNAAAPVAGLVAADGIWPGQVPEGKALPAIAYRQVSAVPTNSVSLAENRRTVRARIEVTPVVPLSKYDQLKALRRAIKLACANQVGTVAGFDHVATWCESEGPDIPDRALGTLEQGIDFMVTFSEALT